MYSFEAPQIYEEPVAGECYCHLLHHHPHGGPNELCEVCKTELDELINARLEEEPLRWQQDERIAA